MIIIYFIAGLFVGSFLNMLIDRLPRDEQIVRGRSHCDHCNHELYWYDLLPVVSWLLLRGRCRYCHKSIPFRNTLVELIAAVLFAVNYIIFGQCLLLVMPGEYECFVGEFARLTILSSLIAIFFIDLKHQIIPDSLTLTVFVAAVLLHIASPSLSIVNYALSGLFAFLFFLFLVLITKGRGMGVGDVKFAGFMGVFLGYPNIIYSLYFAFLTGAIVSAILVLKRKKKFGQTIAFGPFLVIGTVLAQFGILGILWQHIYGNFL